MSAGPRHLRIPTSLRDRCTLLFFCTLVVYLATASYTEQSVDTATMTNAAWQLAQHGNLTMDEFRDDGLWLTESDGRLVTARFPGTWWLATPLYLLDRSEGPTSGMGNLTAAAAAAAAVVVFFLLCLRITTSRRALGASLVLAFATPTWTVSADALWTHGPGQLWLLLGTLLSAGGAGWASGLAFGAAVLTRPHYAFVAAAVGLFDLRSRRRPRITVAIASGTALGLLVLVAYNAWVFGEWGIRTGYDRDLASPDGVGAAGLLENVAGMLLGPSRGVLVLTPFLLLLAPGLRAAWGVAPAWVRGAAAGGTAYMLLQLWLNRWSGGYAFYSYRLPLEWLTLCGPLLLLCYAHWTARSPVRRRVFLALVAFSLATHALGAVLYAPEVVEPAYWSFWPPWLVASEHPVATLVTLAAAGMAVAATARRLSPKAAQLDLQHAP